MRLEGLLDAARQSHAMVIWWKRKRMGDRVQVLGWPTKTEDITGSDARADQPYDSRQRLSPGRP